MLYCHIVHINGVIIVECLVYFFCARVQGQRREQEDLFVLYFCGCTIEGAIRRRWSSIPKEERLHARKFLFQARKITRSIVSVWSGVWFDLVWFGLVWFGLVWSGLVWSGLVWFRFVSFRFVSFHFVSFRFVSLRFSFVSFR